MTSAFDAGSVQALSALRPPDPADLDQTDRIVGPRWNALGGARIFVTGGTGFIGKWLVASAIDADRRHRLGLSLTLLTRHPEIFIKEAPFLAQNPGVTLMRGDVKTFDADPAGYTHVIHAATDAVVGNQPLETFDTCVCGTRRVLDFAARANATKLLLVSSGAVYGRQPPSLEAIPEHFSGGPDTMRTDAAYAEGKRAAEWLATAFSANGSVPVTTARCFAFAGPYLPMDRHFAVGNFLRDAFANRPIVLNGDGTAVRSYLHGCELAGWLWALLIGGRKDTAYNVGGVECVSMRALAGRVLEAVGATSGMEVGESPVPGRLPDRYVPDVSRALEELQLPAPWSIGEILERTVRWLRPAGGTHAVV